MLVTGFTGCIGAATVERLLDEGVDEIVGFSRSVDLTRIGESYRPKIRAERGDVANLDDVRRVVLEHEPTHVVHLAAYQTPDCQAHPFRGMEINVGGTANLFRTAAEVGSVKRFVAASSAAVYGARALYPGASIVETDPMKPSHLYGYWKVCGEGMAEAFHMETGIPTVSLRIATTYGPGRDQGMTSAPTTAVKAVALGVPYAIPYDGREHYHFVGDVASAFCESAIAPFEGLGVFNVRGITTPVSEFVARLRAAAEARDLGSQFQVKIADEPAAFPFASDLDDRAVTNAFPRMTCTDLSEGIDESLARFLQMVETGVLRADMIPSG